MKRRFLIVTEKA